MYDLYDVFTPGGQPKVTYVSRDNGLEATLGDYLAHAGRPLLVVGRFKAGKTVLVRRLTRRAVRIAGGELNTIDGFWNEIVDQLGAYTGETAETFVEEGEDNGDVHSAAAKLGGSGVEASASQSSRSTKGRRHSQTRRRVPRRVAKAELIRGSLPLVVDDFDRIDAPLQRRIVDGVRELIFEGVPVVLVAKSSPGWDAAAAAAGVLGEGEQVLVVDPWGPADLEEIAIRGMTALNVECDPTLLGRMVAASRRNPCLMQHLCLGICKSNGVLATLAEGGRIACDDDIDSWIARQLENVPVRKALPGLADASRPES